MTTVSVQPTTSETNEREAFELYCKRYKFDLLKAECQCCTYDNSETELKWNIWVAAWQHQQNRIDELEEMLQMNADESMREPELIESLQAKLTIAVNALEDYAKTYTTPDEIAIKALSEINKIGE